MGNSPGTGEAPGIAGGLALRGAGGGAAGG